jgi:hypothetical protein
MPRQSEIQFLKTNIGVIEIQCLCGATVRYVPQDFSLKAECVMCGKKYIANFRDTHTEDANGLPINEWSLVPI